MSVSDDAAVEENGGAAPKPTFPAPKVVKMLARDQAEQGVQFVREGGEVAWLRDMRLLRRQAARL